MTALAEEPATAQVRRTYTVQEVASLLGIGDQTVRDLIRRGEFPIKPLPHTGRRLLLPRRLVDAWLDGHPVTSASATQP